MLFGSYNVQKEWADQNPQTFRKLIRVLDKSIAFINKNRQAAKDAMKPYVDETQREYVTYYADGNWLDSQRTNPADFQKMADEFVRLGIISEPLQVRHLVVK